MGAVTPGETLGTLYTSGVGTNKTKQHTRHGFACGRWTEEEEEEEEFIRIHGYYRGTQGARCYTDGASLQPDESEGCSPVSVVGLIRLCAPLGRLTTLLPTSMLSRHGC